MYSVPGPEEGKKQMTNAEVIIENLQILINQWEIMKQEVADGDDPYIPNESEYGEDLTWQIDCHPIFKGDKPCLLDVRNIEMDSKGLYKQHCSECKAVWLMEEYH